MSLKDEFLKLAASVTLKAGRGFGRQYVPGPKTAPVRRAPDPHAPRKLDAADKRRILANQQKGRQFRKMAALFAAFEDELSKLAALSAAEHALRVSTRTGASPGAAMARRADRLKAVRSRKVRQTYTGGATNANKNIRANTDMFTDRRPSLGSRLKAAFKGSR